MNSLLPVRDNAVLFKGLKTALVNLFGLRTQIPTPGSQSSVWFVTELTPDLSKTILEKHNYEKNRPKTKARVIRYVEEINSAGWFPTSCIVFCWIAPRGNQPGKLLLVDGRHRNEGVVESKKPIEVGVCIYACVNGKEVKRVYSKFNTPGETRTDRDLIGNYLEDFETADGVLTGRQVKHLLDAHPLLVGQMHSNSWRRKVQPSHERFKVTTQFSAPAVFYFRCLEAVADKGLNRKLSRPQEMALFISLIQSGAREMAERFLEAITATDEPVIGSGAYWARFFIANTISARNGVTIGEGLFAYGTRDFGHLRRLARAWNLFVTGETADAEAFSETNLPFAVKLESTDIIVNNK